MMSDIKQCRAEARAIRTAIILLALAAFAPAVNADEGQSLALRAAIIHTGDGDVIRDGVILIRDGRIDAVGDISVPEDVETVDLGDAAVTPGLVDANALVEPERLVPQRRAAEIAAEAEAEGRTNFLHTMFADEHEPENCAACMGTSFCALAAGHDELAEGEICPVCGFGEDIWSHFGSGVRSNLVLSETSSEVVPHTHVIDSLNLRSPDFERLLRGGVTTVFASPDNSVVIGPQGLITRTGGPVRDRVLEPADAVTAVISSDSFRGAVRNRPPYRFLVDAQSRRPNTRMGLAWVFRKAFYDTIRYEKNQPVYGADTPPELAFPVLSRILEGDVPLRMHARQQNDIKAAIRLADEFNLSFTLLEATEAYRCIDQLLEARVPVIFGPIYMDPSGPRARTPETRHARLSTLRDLLDAGVETALSAQDLREEDGLARQMMYAVRTGVSPEDAVQAATGTPARLLGIDDRVGVLRDGRHADLVVWSQAPYEAGAVPVVVMLNGRIVIDRRMDS